MAGQIPSDDEIIAALSAMNIADPPAVIQAAAAAVAPTAATKRRQSFAAVASSLGEAQAEAASARAAAAEEAIGRAKAAAATMAGSGAALIKSTWDAVSNITIASVGAAASAGGYTLAAALEAPGNAVKVVAKLAAMGGGAAAVGAVFADLSHGQSSVILLFADGCVRQIAGAADDVDVRAWVFAVLLHELATKGKVSSAALKNLRDLFTPAPGVGGRRKRRGGVEPDTDFEKCLASAIAAGTYVKEIMKEIMKENPKENPMKEYTFRVSGIPFKEPAKFDSADEPTSPSMGGRRTRRRRHRRRLSAPTRKAPSSSRRSRPTGRRRG